MRYLGNFKDWVQPHWVQFALTNQGMGRPRDGKKPDSPEEEIEYAKARSAGYKDDAVYFWMFDKNTVDFSIPQPPFLDGEFHWWITKMLPGNFMPIHVDPHTLIEKSSERFWIPLQDYEPGHIFLYENRVVTDYKAGDVWQYENSSALHGASNIGYSPRIVLQISSFSI